MLPQPVHTDIFNIEFKASQIAIEHICDGLEEFGLITTRYDNYDHAIIIFFTNQHGLTGELRVDRIRRCFDVMVTIDTMILLPFSGDWEHIREYLQKANDMVE